MQGIFSGTSATEILCISINATVSAITYSVQITLKVSVDLTSQEDTMRFLFQHKTNS